VDQHLRAVADFASRPPRQGDLLGKRHSLDYQWWFGRCGSSAGRLGGAQLEGRDESRSLHYVDDQTEHTTTRCVRARSALGFETNFGGSRHLRGEATADAQAAT